MNSRNSLAAGGAKIVQGIVGGQRVGTPSGR
jgi:hypothetical protein